MVIGGAGQAQRPRTPLRNPVFQPASFALNGAWFSGGIEWNIGATGHTTLSVAGSPRGLGADRRP
ncbi:hypothetical protein [Streptomyces sp. 7N604]|uniref:hypothetical protein n=1 Tax=Streptomyces sp. 7N604 TaxID=3457415 RepID=UPI003FD362C1